MVRQKCSGIRRSYLASVNLTCNFYPKVLSFIDWQEFIVVVRKILTLKIC